MRGGIKEDNDDDDDDDDEQDEVSSRFDFAF